MSLASALARRALVLAALLPALPAAAQPAPPPALPLELNRLEPVAAPNEGCRIWMMVENDAPGAAAIAALRLDLVVFGGDGQIARRAAVELAPIGAGRTAVRLFDLAGLPCDRISRLLVNEVLACRIGGADVADCADRLRPSSRAGVRFGL
ncbi:Tat pathway signal protein [Falsiroseomonas tokyonensis]|uniref:Tat pathway signal protein n=1 Tax=Falsiroseomonas tokyonensis TaxID=430521 RepID=A0ABV7BYJ2_9PROT|nr:Tat pathway signal protein [Falsiroseomonas tokyonensis]MBU8539521.1 Tat pathway signal protein [Falsiroseomonas tokyonensis]